MLLQIEKVIDRPMVEAALEAASVPGFWSDGRATASGRAKDAKANEQSLAAGPAKGVLETLARPALDNETVKSADEPAAHARIMLNRYGDGMEYGGHVDAAYIDGVRTDLSFTLALTDPADYDG